MQTGIIYGIKFSNQEMKQHCNLKNIEWMEDIEIDLVFSDIPKEIIYDKNCTIFCFKITEYNESLFELEKLNVPKSVTEKINFFITQNNISKEPGFFVKLN